MKPAVIKGCNHTCPMSDGNKPHVGGVALEGASKVFIENRPACRKGDALMCSSPSKDKISTGSSKVFIENAPAARLGDSTEHGGIVIEGAKKVFIS
ncbi:MAG: PAAR domain-containing protein [Bacteroidota bacterium]